MVRYQAGPNVVEAYRVTGLNLKLIWSCETKYEIRLLVSFSGTKILVADFGSNLDIPAYRIAFTVWLLTNGRPRAVRLIAAGGTGYKVIADLGPEGTIMLR